MSDPRIIELNKKEAVLNQQLAELMALENSVIAKIFQLREGSVFQGATEHAQDSLKDLISSYNEAYSKLCKDVSLVCLVQTIPLVQTLRFAANPSAYSPWQGHAGTKEAFSETLEKFRNKIKTAIDKQNPIKAQKQALLSRLKAYTDRIESHTNESGIDFGYGFSPFLFFINTSRAKNRKANYELAKYLQTDIAISLDNNKDLPMEKFLDVDVVRGAHIRSEDSRGINSTQLKSIIEEGKQEPRWG